jgi:hypothetical protein
LAGIALNEIDEHIEFDKWKFYMLLRSFYSHMLIKSEALSRWKIHELVSHICVSIKYVDDLKKCNQLDKKYVVQSDCN